MIHGDIYWHTFKTPDKKRPVLILTRNNLISQLNSLTVAPISTTLRDEITQVYLDENDGMLTDCAISLVNLQTVPKDKLGKYITHLSEERMKEVFEAIKFVFGFERF